MADFTAEILLVEDNPNDVELTQRALKKHDLANRMFVVNDGAEAIDYLYGTGGIRRTRYGQDARRSFFLEFETSQRSMEIRSGCGKVSKAKNAKPGYISGGVVS